MGRAFVWSTELRRVMPPRVRKEGEMVHILIYHRLAFFSRVDFQQRADEILNIDIERLFSQRVRFGPGAEFRD